MFSKLMGPRGRSLMTWAMVVSLVSLSCVFEPRPSETPPDDQIGGRDDYQPPDEPGVVVENLKKVIGKLDSGSYQDMFTEDFVFVPDPEDVQDMEGRYGPGLYLDWDKAIETMVMER